MVTVFTRAAPPSVLWGQATLALSALLPALAISIANIALPTLAEVFGTSFQTARWVVVAYLLALAVVIVGVGRLGDMIGRRRMLLIGAGLFTLASGACGIAPTLGVLIGARAVQGVGAAILMAMSVALVRETVPEARTGRLMGLLGTVSAIGTALGPVLGGALIAGPGWRAIFVILVPLGALVFGLVWRHLPADAPGTGGSGFDGWGAVALAGTLLAYVAAMDTGAGGFGLRNLVLMLMSVGGALLFLRIEARSAAPLVRLSVLRDAAVARGLAVNAMVATVMMATLVVGPFYLSRGLGLDAVGVGLAMAIGPALSILGGVPAGRLADRFGAARMTRIGLWAMAAGSVALAGLPGWMGIAGYAAAMAILTPGYQMVQAANTAAVMRAAPADARGVVSSLLSLSRNLGLITGATVMGQVYAAATGGLVVAEAATHGLAATFAVAAVLMLGAVWVASARPVRRADAARV